MELYIRSQDKYTLVKYNKNIKIIETKGLKEAFEDSAFGFLKNMEQVQGYLRDGWSIVVDDINLGVYATKERTLEVLNEIQKILEPKIILDSKSINPNGETRQENGIIYQNYNANATIQTMSDYVYEMPKEE